MIKKPWMMVFATLAAMSTLPEQGQAQTRCAHEATLRSLNSASRSTVEFFNGSRQNVQLYWLDFQGKRKHYRDIAPATAHVQQTYATHPWIVTDSAGNCLLTTIPEQRRYVVVINE